MTAGRKKIIRQVKKSYNDVGATFPVMILKSLTRMLNRSVRFRPTAREEYARFTREWLGL